MGFESGLKTIVVATDLDGRSEAALEYARKIAHAYGARIVLAYGLDPLDYAAIDTVPRAMMRDLPEEARAVVRRMSEELSREGIHSHSEIRQGTVVQTLLDVVRQHEAGLIVVGSEGREGAGPVAVGSIVEAAGASGAVSSSGSCRGLECGTLPTDAWRADSVGGREERVNSFCGRHCCFTGTVVSTRACGCACADRSGDFGNSESTLDDTGRFWNQSEWPGCPLPHQGRPSDASDLRCNCAVWSKCSGDGSEARERFGKPSWDRVFVAGPFPCSGAVRASDRIEG